GALASAARLLPNPDNQGILLFPYILHRPKDRAFIWQFARRSGRGPPSLARRPTELPVQHSAPVGLERLEQLLRVRVVGHSNNQMNVVGHNGGGKERPAAKTGGFVKLNQAGFSLRFFEEYR